MPDQQPTPAASDGQNPPATQVFLDGTHLAECSAPEITGPPAFRAFFLRLGPALAWYQVSPQHAAGIHNGMEFYPDLYQNVALAIIDIWVPGTPDAHPGLGAGLEQ
jgi:hypothetical protein